MQHWQAHIHPPTQPATHHVCPGHVKVGDRRRQVEEHRGAAGLQGGSQGAQVLRRQGGQAMVGGAGGDGACEHMSAACRQWPLDWSHTESGFCNWGLCSTAQHRTGQPSPASAPSGIQRGLCRGCGGSGPHPARPAPAPQPPPSAAAARRARAGCRRPPAAAAGGVDVEGTRVWACRQAGSTACCWRSGTRARSGADAGKQATSQLSRQPDPG